MAFHPQMTIGGRISRRHLVAGAGALLLAPTAARAQLSAPDAPRPPSDLFYRARAELADGREIRPGRVQLDLPRLAENGNSVSVGVRVESPMTAEDHVRTIHLLSERNPIAVIGRFHIGPRSGRAEVRTYIRLASTQNIHAVAEMSDGTLWTAQGESVVLLAACLDPG